MELLEERRDLVRRNTLEKREHHGLAALDELLGPEADAGEHSQAPVVELDDLLAAVVLGRKLVLGPGREALDVRVPGRESTGESGALEPHRHAVVLTSRRWREDHEILICAPLLAIRARSHPSS